jgi:hypothetical protein
VEGRVSRTEEKLDELSHSDYNKEKNFKSMSKTYKPNGT